MDDTNQNQPQVQQTIVLVGKQKSVGIAFLLAFLFGPLGLLYASVTGGIVMFILGIIIGIVTLGLGLILVWIGSIIWAIIAASNANQNAINRLKLNTNFGGQQPTHQQPQATPHLIQPQPTSKLIQSAPANPQSIQTMTSGQTVKHSFDLGVWFDKNKRSVFIGLGSFVVLLILFVATKFVVNLDFGKKDKYDYSNTQAMQTPQTSTSEKAETAQPVGNSTDKTPGMYVVTADKANFFDSPDPQTVRKGYIIKGNKIDIQQVQNDYGYGVYTSSSGKQISGWLLLLDFQKVPNSTIGNDDISNFENFWVEFQYAVKSNNKEKVSEMTNFPFYDGSLSLYKDRTAFLSTYQYVFDDDGMFMINNAKIGQVVTVRQKANEPDIKYEDGATVNFEKVADKSFLKTCTTKFKLSSATNIYELSYHFEMVVETSSHPYQGITEYFYFAQTATGFKLCGKGML